ncbi:unnamed protein product [Pedinophyceae sp. YPF-701]|nr:unnamed protein product [Pedinophyceae sp. YPF-701]
MSVAPMTPSLAELRGSKAPVSADEILHARTAQGAPGEAPNPPVRQSSGYGRPGRTLADVLRPSDAGGDTQHVQVASASAGEMPQRTTAPNADHPALASSGALGESTGQGAPVLGGARGGAKSARSNTVAPLDSPTARTTTENIAQKPLSALAPPRDLTRPPERPSSVAELDTASSLPAHTRAALPRPHAPRKRLPTIGPGCSAELEAAALGAVRGRSALARPSVPSAGLRSGDRGTNDGAHITSVAGDLCFALQPAPPEVPGLPRPPLGRPAPPFSPKGFEASTSLGRLVMRSKHQLEHSSKRQSASLLSRHPAPEAPPSEPESRPRRASLLGRLFQRRQRKGDEAPGGFAKQRSLLRLISRNNTKRRSGRPSDAEQDSALLQIQDQLSPLRAPAFAMSPTLRRFSAKADEDDAALAPDLRAQSMAVLDDLGRHRPAVPHAPGSDTDRPLPARWGSGPMDPGTGLAGSKRRHLIGGDVRKVVEDEQLATFEDIARYIGSQRLGSRTGSLTVAQRGRSLYGGRRGSILRGGSTASAWMAQVGGVPELGRTNSVSAALPGADEAQAPSPRSATPKAIRASMPWGAAAGGPQDGGSEAAVRKSLGSRPAMSRGVSALSATTEAQSQSSRLVETRKLNIGSVDGRTANFFNHYHIVKTIGSGANGDVKLCMDLKEQQLVAVKLVIKAPAGAGRARRPAFGQRQGADKATTLKKEAEVLKSLDHPNVVHVYEIIDDDRAPHLLCVMEYVEGGPVQVAVCTDADDGSREILSETTAGDYFIQLVDGLDYLHSNRVIHGDIKPDNLLLGADGLVRLADFGSASTLAPGQEDKLLAVNGTPAFLAPEICRGEEYSGVRADFWAAGVTLYMLLFGRLPFGDFSMRTYAMYDAISDDDLVFPEHPPVSDLAKDLLSRMLDKDPLRRPTVEEIVTHPWLAEVLDLDDDALGPLPGFSRQSAVDSQPSGRGYASTPGSRVEPPHRESSAGEAAVPAVPWKRPEAPHAPPSPAARPVRAFASECGSTATMTPRAGAATRASEAPRAPGDMPVATSGGGRFAHIVGHIEAQGGLRDVVPRQSWRPGQDLMVEGEDGDCMFFIITGRAEVLKHMGGASGAAADEALMHDDDSSSSEGSSVADCRGGATTTLRSSGSRGVPPVNRYASGLTSKHVSEASMMLMMAPKGAAKGGRASSSSSDDDSMAELGAAPAGIAVTLPGVAESQVSLAQTMPARGESSCPGDASGAEQPPVNKFLSDRSLQADGAHPAKRARQESDIDDAAMQRAVAAARGGKGVFNKSHKSAKKAPRHDDADQEDNEGVQLEYLVMKAAETANVLDEHLRTGAAAEDVRVLAHIGPGDVVGEMTLLGRATRTATVRAVTDVTALVVDKAALGRLATAMPRLQQALKQLIAERVATRRMMEAFEQLATLHGRYGASGIEAPVAAAGGVRRSAIGDARLDGAPSAEERPLEAKSSISDAVAPAAGVSSTMRLMGRVLSRKGLLSQHTTFDGSPGEDDATPNVSGHAPGGSRRVSAVGAPPGVMSLGSALDKAPRPSLPGLRVSATGCPPMGAIAE